MQIDFAIPAPPARHAIVHLHIFKNGGSTIEAILQREFPGRYATLHGLHANSALDEHDVAAFLESHPRVAALSSHHLRYPLPKIRRTVLFDCCFLRHPLDRLHSIYSYLRFEPLERALQDPLVGLSKKLSARDFILRLMDESPHAASNAQTLLLAHAGRFTRPLHEGDLEVANEVVKEMAIPGLVHMFDESLVAAEHFLGPAFPDLRLHYLARNVVRPFSRRLDQRLEELTRVWGSDVFDELSRLNRLDLELCAVAEKEIGRRLALVPNVEDRLADFRARCSSLRLEAAS
jgi:hypothetical protein